MNIKPNTNMVLLLAGWMLVTVCVALILVYAFTERRISQREVFDQGALHGASVVLQSNQQGVTNMDVRVFLDAAWWLHTNKGGTK